MEPDENLIASYKLVDLGSHLPRVKDNKDLLVKGVAAKKVTTAKTIQIYESTEEDIKDGEILECMSQAPLEDEFVPPARRRRHGKRRVTVKRYKCDICKAIFRLKNGLRAHMMSHIRAYLYKCDICPSSYMDRPSLWRHKRESHHNIYRQCFCINCRKVNTQFHSLKGRLFTCSFCDKNFASQSLLKYHQISHDESKILVCEYCGKQFTSFKVYEKHVSQHLKKKEKKIYKCAICDVKFNHPALLTRHRLIHFPEAGSGVTCVLCKMVFRSKDLLQTHMKSHTALAERNFQVLENIKLQKKNLSSDHDGVDTYSIELETECEESVSSFLLVDKNMPAEKAVSNESMPTLGELISGDESNGMTSAKSSFIQDCDLVPVLPSPEDSSDSDEEQQQDSSDSETSEIIPSLQDVIGNTHTNSWEEFRRTHPWVNGSECALLPPEAIDKTEERKKGRGAKLLSLNVDFDYL